jgi:hypothetical protein
MIQFVEVGFEMLFLIWVVGGFHVIMESRSRRSRDFASRAGKVIGQLLHVKGKLDSILRNLE